MTGYQVVHMLEGVVTRGTAQRLRDLNRHLFGKTGTTSGPNDVWFIGGTPDIVAGVYVGYDQPRSLGGWAQGGRIAAPIFEEFARATIVRSEEHTSELQSLMRISYAGFCLKKKKNNNSRTRAQKGCA